MGFFDFFTSSASSEVKRYGKLYDSLQVEFPELEEKQLITMSCIAGLMARVAYTDFHLEESEVKAMQQVLSDWKISDAIDQSKVVQMAIDHIKDMAGLENHLYVHPLKTILSKEERYKVLQSLFLIAASDGQVENIESVEIKVICQGLELSPQHFISARAEVLEFINALK